MTAVIKLPTTKYFPVRRPQAYITLLTVTSAIVPRGFLNLYMDAPLCMNSWNLRQLRFDKEYLTASLQEKRSKKDEHEKLVFLYPFMDSQ